MADLSWLQAIESLAERGDERHQVFQLRGARPQHREAQLEGCYRLLIRKVLVGGNEEVEFGFGEPEELSVFDPGPTHLRDRMHLNARELPLEQPGQVLVEEDAFHAT